MITKAEADDIIAVDVNIQTFWNGFRFSPVGIQVNKGYNVPFFTKLISRIIIMGRIQTEIFNL